MHQKHTTARPVFLPHTSQHATDAMMLTAVADAAMYEAKKRGGQWCVFDAQQMSLPCSDTEPKSFKDASSSIVD